MRALTLAVGIALLAGCGKKPDAVVPPPPVTVATATVQNVPLTLETFGNCVTIADVTLQPQVTGNLLRYAVDQGSMVKAGDLIAEIDPAPFQAAVEEAQGNLDAAKATLANAQVTLARQQKLYETRTIDIADLQNAEANELRAQGDVLTAQGQLAQAQINLGYCRITAPVSGKTGIYLLDAGNLATANQSKLLNIQTIDPIFVDFTIPENAFPSVRGYLASGSLDVECKIPGDAGGPIAGKLTVIDNAISSSTGTLLLRATFPNSDGRLWPGLFVNVSLILTTLNDAVLVPASCVMVGQQGPYVFVVNADDSVTLRPVETSQRQGDDVVVAQGVSAGERVVTAGQLGLVTGKKISPQPVPTPSPVATK